MVLGARDRADCGHVCLIDLASALRSAQWSRSVAHFAPTDAPVLSTSIFGFFSPGWPLLPAMADSSQVCLVPFGFDALVAVLSARHGEIFWVFPPIVTAASLVGAALTYWVGQTAGHAGLPRLVPARHLERMKARLATTGAAALAAAAVMPPPFPLTAFQLTCGALDFDRRRFFLVFGVMRLVRFAAVALLARYFGDRVRGVLEMDGVQTAVTTLIWITVAAAITFGIVVWCRTRPQPA
jgi:membrane protein YqaA with SNARE-associated domain